MISLHDPAWLAALLVIPALVWLRSRHSVSVWLVPSAGAWSAPRAMRRQHWALVAQIGSLVLLIAALSRPQRFIEAREPIASSRDIMLVVDVSASMLIEDYEQEDYRASRMEMLRPLLKGIIDGRPSDRIGAVLFSGHPATLCPLTLDHAELERRLAGVVGGTSRDGTAIGDALALAMLRLVPHPEAPAAIRNDAAILLFTDGANNKGLFAPMESAAMAKSAGIPIHAFAFGTVGYAEMPYIDASGKKSYRPMFSETDEPTLWNIAHHTGGRFLHGAAYNALEKALAAIETAQPSRVRFLSHIEPVELFPLLAWLAVGLSLGAVLPGVAQAIRLLVSKWVTAHGDRDTGLRNRL